MNQACGRTSCSRSDRDYIVEDGEVMHDRRVHRPHDARPPLSDGLHQAIEAKEGVKIQPENVTLATVTFQNYFRHVRPSWPA